MTPHHTSETFAPVEHFTREVQSDREEFLRELPDAISRREFTLQGDLIRIPEKSGAVWIRMTELGEKHLGKLDLPMMRLDFAFEGLSQPEIASSWEPTSCEHCVAQAACSGRAYPNGPPLGTDARTMLILIDNPHYGPAPSNGAQPVFRFSYDNRGLVLLRPAQGIGIRPDCGYFCGYRPREMPPCHSPTRSYAMLDREARPTSSLMAMGCISKFVQLGRSCGGIVTG